MKITEFQNIQKFKFLPTDTTTDDVRIRELTWIASYLPLKGLNIEFGVHSGLTISCVANLLPHLKFHGFDSFTGLPEDWDMGYKMVKKESFDCEGELPEVPNNVELHKGWFNETIPKFLNKHKEDISYLHIDSDIYSSATTILEECNNQIVKGTIIRFDELCCWRHAFTEATPPNDAKRVLYPKWPDHEWKALNEWLDKYNRKVIPISRSWFQSATMVVTQ
jgi:hypothetical protein